MKATNETTNVVAKIKTKAVEQNDLFALFFEWKKDPSFVLDFLQGFGDRKYAIKLCKKASGVDAGQFGEDNSEWQSCLIESIIALKESNKKTYEKLYAVSKSGKVFSDLDAGEKTRPCTIFAQIFDAHTGERIGEKRVSVIIPQGKEDEYTVSGDIELKLWSTENAPNA